MHSSESYLRVRLNQIDYALIPPGSLDNSNLPKVPVLRIYGLSSTGKKACLHVHQVYPYFFIEYPGLLDPDTVNRYIARFSHSLDHAIAVSLKRNPRSSKSRYVRAILLVKGVPFYGFHASYSPFLKISIANPGLVHRAVTILQSGTVMRTNFRVFESHLSYPLQFMCDFGLYGCGWVELGKDIWLRGKNEDLEDEDEQDNAVSQSSKTLFKTSPYFRQSRMPIELDVIAHQILNRHRLNARNIHHRLEIPEPPLPSEPLVLSVRELWEDERRRRTAKGLNPSPEIPIDPSEKSRGKGGDWVAEAKWWDEMRAKIERDALTDNEVKEPSSSWERWVMTTFESVEALWTAPWKVWKPTGQETTGQGQVSEVENPFSSAGGSEPSGLTTTFDLDIDVDETILSSQELNQLVAQEEVDWAAGDVEQEVYEDDGTGIFFDDNPLNEVPAAGGQGSEASIDDDPFTGTSGGPTSSTQTWLKSKEAIAEVSDLDNAPFTPTKSTENVAESLSTTPIKRPYKQHETSTNSPPKDLEICGDTTEAARELLHLQDATISGTYVDNTDILQAAGVMQKRELPAVPLAQENTPPPKRRNFTITKTRSTEFPMATKISPLSPTASFPKATSDYLSSGTNFFVYALKPPSTVELLARSEEHGIPSKIYRVPYYSKDVDVPERGREYAGLVYHLQGDGLEVLDDWDDAYSTAEVKAFGNYSGATRIYGWEYASSPPTFREADKWLKSDAVRSSLQQKLTKHNSQIEGPTQANPFGFKESPSSSSDASREKQNMSVFSCEVFAPSRKDFVPDADLDEIAAISYSFQDDEQADCDRSVRYQNGAIVIDGGQLNSRRLRDVEMEVVSNELELLNRFVDIVLSLDPDIVVGWEVQAASWGYLEARGRHYGFDLSELISRAPSNYSRGGNEEWGSRHNSTFRVVGRHVLNVWRIMRMELTLNIYTFENVAFHLLRKRVPRYTHCTLTAWYKSAAPAHASRLMRYLSDRTAMILEMLEISDTITKNAEFARVFGIDFFSVISRGSQFKVESFMFRIAKPESFVLLSPNKKDVGRQNAAECLPLIMEPLSAFYNSPLVVLDFQSLYPSVMIAYNYCYSTCLGRVVDFQGKNKFGVAELNHPPHLLATLKDHINVAPNGIMYTKPEVRKGLLGRMLTELLDTRVMVKQAMKGVKDDKVLRRILDARQLSLKFICNVTYGYTSASYSGRMPAVEIADSIVQGGRETLEKAIRTIDSTKKWGAKVVYGDTDSLFVYLKGRTKEQAFAIGYDMADTITAMNPAPIKLKFEKVYLPCVLMAKKRYVGNKFETPDEKEPVFDAKGIETVRRDGILAQQKMTETCLKILFRTQDLSRVKEYCTRSWHLILENRISLQDFIFAKEVAMGTYSDRVPPPPGVAVAARRIIKDRNDEPQYGERVPYVIIRGEPNSRLVDRAVTPQEALADRNTLDGAYYISRVLIPPLERIFNLVGADVRSWYDEMPKTLKADAPDLTSFSPPKAKPNAVPTDKPKIDEYFYSSQCLTCGSPSLEGVCHDCRLLPQTTIASLRRRIQARENRLLNAQRICASCTGSGLADEIQCDSLDCPWFFERKKAEGKAEMAYVLQNLIHEVEIETDF